MVNSERMELLAQVAELYYIQSKSQADIAKEFDFSRSKVSRLLSEARESGMVDIRINFPLQRALELEKIFSARYDLKHAMILETGNQSGNQVLRSLGRLGANYLRENMSDGNVLGISWGTGVYEVAHAFRSRKLFDVCVVQIIGSLGYGDPTIDGPEVARHIASAFSGKYYTMNAPVIVQDKTTRDSLLRERNIREVLDMAKKADYFLVGIGSTNPDRSGLVRAGYLSKEEISTINRASGAVGDIGCRLYNQDGDYQQIEFNQRVVGISLDQLQEVEGEVIGIAGGEEKAHAILGALRGKLIDILITDDSAAEKILLLDSKNKEKKGRYAKTYIDDRT